MKHIFCLVACVCLLSFTSFAQEIGADGEPVKQSNTATMNSARVDQTGLAADGTPISELKEHVDSPSPALTEGFNEDGTDPNAVEVLTPAVRVKGPKPVRTEAEINDGAAPEPAASHSNVSARPLRPVGTVIGEEDGAPVYEEKGEIRSKNNPKQEVIGEEDGGPVFAAPVRKEKAALPMVKDVDRPQPYEVSKPKQVHEGPRDIDVAPTTPLKPEPPKPGTKTDVDRLNEQKN